MGQGLSYYHRDEQLSTAFITGRDGEIQNSYLYDAFGAKIEANEQAQNRIRYTGQQYDDLTGQYYLRARYYNPVIGRFMQEDAYWGDGLNLYAYCGNNPVMYSDPRGYTYTVSDALNSFYESGVTLQDIRNSNNSWNSFRSAVGYQGYSKDLIEQAYSELQRTNADGHYIHRTYLSQADIDRMDHNKVVGATGTYQDVKTAGILQIDNGHTTNYEFWRTRNAAESLGWTLYIFIEKDKTGYVFG